MPIPMLRSALVATLVLAGSVASADPISKEACVDAHSRGQDARDTGKVSLARKLFLTCAQTSCPALVQNDCAKFANELDQAQPTITFSARDTNGTDLPDTTVYVDDILIVTRLDDGRSHDTDPGRHVVKFQNNGRDQVMTVVLNSGEKGRAVTAKFPAAALPEPTARSGTSPVAPVTTQTPPPPLPVVPPKPVTTHPTGAKLALLAGGVAVLGGGALYIVGAGKVPGDCSSSSKTCTVGPGDPELTTASHALRLENIGIAVGAVGAAALVGGAVWYFKGRHTEREEQPGFAAVPWVSPTSAGISFSGRL